MNIQIIEKDGSPEWAVLPYRDYEKLKKMAETLKDIRDYRRAVSRPDEKIPGDVVHRILDGENPVRVWREYRAISQQALASAAHISTAYLSQIETEKRVGTSAVLRAIARALNVPMEGLLPAA